MKDNTLHSIVRWAIATVWLGNGLLAKVLGLVPRHEEIVARILGVTHAHALTVVIGLAEIALGVWVLAGWRTRLTAALQIAAVLCMNALEYRLAGDLLLWGRLNIVFASAFVAVVYWYAFRLDPVARWSP